MRTLTALGGVAATAVLVTGCGSGTDSDTGGGACTYTRTGNAAKKVDPPPADPDPAGSLTITTNRGEITATLDTAKAPCTTGSFTSLAKQEFFDNTKCHRLTTDGNFLLQCGDPTATGFGGPGYSFADELDGRETYPAGTLAMANSGVDTNGSQFFLVYADTPLPPSYTVFGKLDAAGLEVVTAIAKAGTSDGGPDGAPKQDVTIESVR